MKPYIYIIAAIACTTAAYFVGLTIGEKAGVKACEPRYTALKSYSDSLKKMSICQDYAFYKTVVKPIEFATCKVVVADVYETYKKVAFDFRTEEQLKEMTKDKRQLEAFAKAIIAGCKDPNEEELSKSCIKPTKKPVK